MVESRSEMKPIGGYFELADSETGTPIPIEDGVFLNTGRNALEYILKGIPDVKKVHLPLYTCEAVLEPLKRNYITYNFYHINNRFEIADTIQLYEGEYLIANNYFGIKDAYISQLAKKYQDRLIVDNAQAFFAPPIYGTKSFYSPRKYVGVADGGIAVGVDGKFSLCFDEDDSTQHDSHLYIRKEQGAEAGFKHFKKNETKLNNQPIRAMCRNTRDILCHIDYDKVITRRRKNFNYLHSILKSTNHLQIPEYETFSCPMVYPYWRNNEKDIRWELIKNKVFVACYWPNVLNWSPLSSLEHLLAERVIPIPVDQRYGEEEMKRIIEVINP